MNAVTWSVKEFCSYTSKPEDTEAAVRRVIQNTPATQVWRNARTLLAVECDNLRRAGVGEIVDNTIIVTQDYHDGKKQTHLGADYASMPKIYTVGKLLEATAKIAGLLDQLDAACNDAAKNLGYTLPDAAAVTPAAGPTLAERLAADKARKEAEAVKIPAAGK